MKVKIWLLIFLLLLAWGAEADSMAAAGSRILEQGDNLIHGFTYLNGYLWASTRTSPCRILRIDAETLSYDRVILDAGLNDGEDITAADGYVWVILWTNPSRIVRVNPETLEWEVAVAFQQNELFQGGSLKYAFGYLWAGGCCGKIARINPKDLSYQVYDYSRATGSYQFHAITSGGGYVWGSAPAFQDSWFWGREYIGNTIVRVNPDNPTDYSSVFVDDINMSDDIAYTGGHLYAGSESSPSYIYKFSDDLSYDWIRAADTVCYGLYAYDDEIWGTYVGSPGRIIRFDPDLNIVAIYQLPQGFKDANEIAFDATGNIYYVTCWDSPARVVKLERLELHYSISALPDEDRGGVMIPVETFPEGRGSLIPIYVPPLIDGSNVIREDGSWKTIREIRKSKLSFEWEKLIAGTALESADTPAGAAFSAIAGLISALENALSVSECRITIQRNAGSGLRAIISIGDPDRRTFLRAYAGDGWVDPVADSFWLVRAAFSDYLAETFRLEPDDFPDRYYTIGINIDPAHKDDPYVGYLSQSRDGKVVMTPRIYPQDELRVRRINEFIIPYKIETVIDFAGDAFINLMEGTLSPGVIRTVSYSPSESVITVQGRSPIEIRVHDSQGKVTGLVDGEAREGIPGSLYYGEGKAVIIFSPKEAYRYEVIGTDDGEYGLEVNSIEGGKADTFTAANIPTSPGAVHEYTIDWGVLSKGGEGVAVQIDSNGDGAYERSIASDSEFTQDEYLSVTGVTSNGKYPATWGDLKRTELLQNYPNPFNPDTWIPYQLADDADVAIRIYDASGQLIRTLDLGHKQMGSYTNREKAVHWDGRNESGEPVSSGVCFYNIRAGGFTATKKMAIAK